VIKKYRYVHYGSAGSSSSSRSPLLFYTGRISSSCSLVLEGPVIVLPIVAITIVNGLESFNQHQEKELLDEGSENWKACGVVLAVLQIEFMLTDA